MEDGLNDNYANVCNNKLKCFIRYDGVIDSMCSKCGFGVIISEGIIDYAFNVMLLVQYDGRRAVIVS